MKNKKLIIIIAAISALLICVATLVLCLTLGGNKVKDVYIASTNAPRLTYVQGQELDLSSGSLTVITKKEEAEIPLNSDDITVSGYNKDTLGEQTVTFTYKKLSATVTVTVIPRIVASGYEENYFVKDLFNKEAGKLTIATDDATTFNINMNDSRVSLVSFDSSKAGNVTVTVSYTDGTDTYNCQFDVTVYEHASVSFTPPQKTVYLSHETDGPSVEGGYFTVISADSNLKKEVKLTKEMVKGFDLSKATMSNRVDGFPLTLNVEYLSNKFTYDIEIIYSGVSVVNYYGNGILANINWNSDPDPRKALTEAEAEAAVDAISAYYELDDNSKDLISDEIIGVVARAGAVAVSDLFEDELEKYKETFAIDELNNLYLIASDYLQVASDLEKIKDNDEDLNVFAELLINLKDDFADIKVTSDKTIGQYVKVYTRDMRNRLVQVIEHMVNIYAPIASIPDDWEISDLEEYADDILGVTLQISRAGYYTDGDADIYTSYISDWRNDYFEILYSYFLYVEEDTDFVSKNMLGKVPLPGLLEDWYASFSLAIYHEELFDQYYVEWFYQHKLDGFLEDVTPFMYNYFSALELSERIKSSGNTLWNDIYTACDGDKLNLKYMYNYNYGYLYHVGGMRDSEKFNSLWNSYYELIKLYESNELDSDTHAEEIKEMFDILVSLAPSEVYGFLSSLNFMYSLAPHPNNVLSYGTDSSYNVFTLILRDYYLPLLEDDVKPLFAELLLAIENYALVGHNSSAMDNFNANMEALVSGYTDLADKTNFNNYLLDAYTKYSNIYDLANGDKTVDLTDDETALIDELHKTLERYFVLHAYMGTLNENHEPIPDNLYGILYTSFAKADAIYKELVKNASPDALGYLFQKTYDLNGSEYTLDDAWYLVDQTTTSMLDARVFGDTSSENSIVFYGWNLYKDYDLEELFAEIAPLLYYGYNSSGIEITANYIVGVMNSIRGLNGWQYSILVNLDVADAYYEAIEKYFESVLTDDGSDAADMLLDAEIEYRKNGKTSAFNSLIMKIETAYVSISSEDKAYLSDMYSYYTGL